MSRDVPDYGYTSSAPIHAHSYLLPVVDRVLDEVRPTRIFDLGCGNGSVAYHMSRRCEVVGIDASESAIDIANKSFPALRVERGSAYDDLAAMYGTFSAVVSLEVVEHLYDPRKFAGNIFDLLEPAGVAIISTPYHGYLKNVALAVSGKLDDHFTALWDGGHIKFWSIPTLSKLLIGAGLEITAFHRVGRVPVLAKSMVAIARKPESCPTSVLMSVDW